MGVGEVKKEHEIHLIRREEMSIFGVCEVISFDDEGVRLMSIEGELSVEGEGIKIGVLDIDRGLVTISGKIDGFFYEGEEKNKKRGFFSKRSH